ARDARRRQRAGPAGAAVGAGAPVVARGVPDRARRGPAAVGGGARRGPSSRTTVEGRRRSATTTASGADALDPPEPAVQALEARRAVHAAVALAGVAERLLLAQGLAVRRDHAADRALALTGL